MIVGGGYIGVEVAADCLQKGVSVTLVERHCTALGPLRGAARGRVSWPTCCARRAPTSASARRSRALTGSGRVAGARLKSGGEIAGDFAVVGVGVTPRTDLAKAAGLDVDPRQGIRVNQFLETSAPDVWAAGDATCFFDPVYDRAWHVEHWNNAFWHGEIAGANIAGERIAYDHVPNFFSDFLDNHMELFGDPQAGSARC